MDQNHYVEDALSSKRAPPLASHAQFLVLPDLTAEQQLGAQAVGGMCGLALGAPSDSNMLKLCAIHLPQKIF